MYIEEVCIDGFKSYAKRTVVPGFDPLFNAITGLNGSGKSNILDSICFVLGISNLTHVRPRRRVGARAGRIARRALGGRDGWRRARRVWGEMMTTRAGGTSAREARSTREAIDR